MYPLKKMNPGHGKKRMNNNNKVKRTPGVDRLSSLPNDLIHKILSNISIKDSVQTIDVLSSRYRYIWTTLPYINFSTEDFPRSQKVSKFVTQFLRRRDSQIDVSCMKLTFRGEVTQPFVKKLMDYAFSHNIQKLEVTCLLENLIEFPFSLFRSTSLKHLSLEGKLYRSYRSVFGRQILRATSTLELPALTTLCLHNVELPACDADENCAALFFKCANLKNITFRSCETNASLIFTIYIPSLANLTLEEGFWGVKVVIVVAPQLENLTIRCENYSRREHEIHAPNLASLAYRGFYPLRLSTQGFPCLKEAYICYSMLWANNTIRKKIADAFAINRLFLHLHSVDFLTFRRY